MVERERDVYRLLARRWQSRLNAVLQQQRQTGSDSFSAHAENLSSMESLISDERAASFGLGAMLRQMHGDDEDEDGESFRGENEVDTLHDNDVAMQDIMCENTNEVETDIVGTSELLDENDLEENENVEDTNETNDIQPSRPEDGNDQLMTNTRVSMHQACRNNSQVHRSKESLTIRRESENESHTTPKSVELIEGQQTKAISLSMNDF